MAAKRKPLLPTVTLAHDGIRIMFGDMLHARIPGPVEDIGVSNFIYGSRHAITYTLTGGRVMEFEYHSRDVFEAIMRQLEAEL